MHFWQFFLNLDFEILWLGFFPYHYQWKRIFLWNSHLLENVFDFFLTIYETVWKRSKTIHNLRKIERKNYDRLPIKSTTCSFPLPRINSICLFKKRGCMKETTFLRRRKVFPLCGIFDLERLRGGALAPRRGGQLAPQRGGALALQRGGELAPQRGELAHQRGGQLALQTGGTTNRRCNGTAKRRSIGTAKWGWIGTVKKRWIDTEIRWQIGTAKKMLNGRVRRQKLTNLLQFARVKQLNTQSTAFWVWTVDLITI